TITVSIPSLTPGLVDSTGGPFYVVQCPQVISAHPARAGDKLLYSQYFPEVVISRTTYVDVSNTSETGTAVVHFFAIPLSHPTEESAVDGNHQLLCTLLSDASLIVPIRVTSCAIGCASQNGLAEVALILYSTDDGSAVVLEVVRSLA
ncbi:GPI-anchored surface protein, putative, partial [Bodo saltans]